MFLSSQAVEYLSSVVMLISAPSEMGMSSSSLVLPVRISGPFYSQVRLGTADGPEPISRWGGIPYRAQLPAVDRAPSVLLPSHCRSLTDGTTEDGEFQDCCSKAKARYLIRAVRKVHAHDIETGWTSLASSNLERALHLVVPLRS